MEANRIPVTSWTNGCLGQIRSGHRDRCTNQTLTMPAWSCWQGKFPKRSIWICFCRKILSF